MKIEIDRKKTQDHWLEVVVKEGDDVWAEAHLKWDGCVQYTRYFNEPRDTEGRRPGDADSIHICSMRDFIEQLEQMERMAVEHFGIGEWKEPPVTT